LIIERRRSPDQTFFYLFNQRRAKSDSDQVRPVVCAYFLASPISVILDHLRCGSSAGCDLRGSKSIGPMLQYSNFCCVQWLAQQNLRFVVTLTSSPTRLHFEADVRELTRGPSLAALSRPLPFRNANLDQILFSRSKVATQRARGSEAALPYRTSSSLEFGPCSRRQQCPAQERVGRKGSVIIASGVRASPGQK
jgi:hypothetical protein